MIGIRSRSKYASLRAVAVAVLRAQPVVASAASGAIGRLLGQ